MTEDAQKAFWRDNLYMAYQKLASAADDFETVFRRSGDTGPDATLRKMHDELRQMCGFVMWGLLTDEDRGIIQAEEYEASLSELQEETYNAPVTLAEAAEKLGVQYQQVYRLWLRGRIASKRRGASIMVRPSDVREALKNYKPRRVAKSRPRHFV